MMLLVLRIQASVLQYRLLWFLCYFAYNWVRVIGFWKEPCRVKYSSPSGVTWCPHNMPGDGNHLMPTFHAHSRWQPDVSWWLYRPGFSTVKLLSFSIPCAILCGLRTLLIFKIGEWISWIFFLIVSSFYVWLACLWSLMPKCWSHSRMSMHPCFQKLSVCTDLCWISPNAEHCKMKSGHVMLQCHLFSTHVLSGFTEQTVVEKKSRNNPWLAGAFHIRLRIMMGGHGNTVCFLSKQHLNNCRKGWNI